MGFVANAVKSVVGGVARVFGGDSGGGQTVVQQQQQAAAQGAAPATNSAQSDMAENTSSEIAKRKRGKRSLMVNTSDNSTGGTGLNI